jgi:hypothetical protein
MGLVARSSVAHPAGTLSADLLPYLPSNAGQAFTSSIRTDEMLAPWTGLGVFAL